MITKPLLASAIKPNQYELLQWPLLASRKVDGIRCLYKDGKLLSRNFKPIPNVYVRKYLEEHLKGFDGLDGELILQGNKTFQEISSAIMSHDGEPSFEYAIFDHVNDRLDEEFKYRYERVCMIANKLKDRVGDKIFYLEHTELNNMDELSIYESRALLDGYEGVMLRSPSGKYKCGRSTFKESILLKVKQFTDAEAKIIGFEERMHNNNEKVRDELGYSKRSSHKDNMVGVNTLGALRVVDVTTGVEFSIGTGFDDALRLLIWSNRDIYINKIVKYKFQPFGVKESTGVPRFPVFLGFRHENDL